MFHRAIFLFGSVCIFGCFTIEYSKIRPPATMGLDAFDLRVIVSPKKIEDQYVGCDPLDEPIIEGLVRNIPKTFDEERGGHIYRIIMQRFEKDFAGRRGLSVYTFTTPPTKDFEVVRGIRTGMTGICQAVACADTPRERLICLFDLPASTQKD